MNIHETHAYQNNIKKAYIFKFLTMFHVFAGVLIPYIYFSALITGLCFIGVALSTHVALTVVCIVLGCAFGVTRQALLQNYMNKFVESHNRATVLSVVSMLYNISAAVLAVMWGYLVDWNMTITLFVIGSLIIVLTIFSRIEEDHLLD